MCVRVMCKINRKFTDSHMVLSTVAGGRTKEDDLCGLFSGVCARDLHKVSFGIDNGVLRVKPISEIAGKRDVSGHPRDDSRLFLK